MAHRDLSRRLRGVVAAVPFAALVATTGAVPARAAEPGTTFVTIHDTGDYRRRPAGAVLHSRNTLFKVSGTPSSVWVGASGSRGNYGFTFGAPQGETLRRGTYRDTWPTPDFSAARAVLDIDDEYSCASRGSSFTVRDIAFAADGTLDRLWVTYEYRCADSIRARTGHVAVNQPSVPVMVYNSPLAFPPTYPETGADQYVWVRNRGTTSFTVGRATVGGSDPGAFHVAGSSCGTVAPGYGCAFRVRFRPPDGGTYAATLTIPTSAGTRTVALSGRGVPGHTALRLRSEVADRVGRGGRYDYTPANAWFETNAAGGRFWARAYIGAHDGTHDLADGLWSLDLLAPEGERFAAGRTYATTALAPHTPGVGMSVHGKDWDAGCSQIVGSFTVHEAAYAADAYLDRFAATFEYRCADAADSLHGWISYRASAPNVPPALAPPAVAGLRADASGNVATLSWDLPPGAAGTVVRLQNQLDGVARRPGDGDAVYSGPATSVVVGPYDWAARTVSVFSVGANRHAGPLRTVTLYRTGLRIGRTATAVTYGSPVTIRLRLLHPWLGPGIAGRQVSLYARRPGGAWFAVGTGRTGADGRASFTLTPRRTYEYVGRFAGEANYFASDSGVVPVEVRTRVSATASATTVARNAEVTVRGEVAPSKAGQPVHLERWAGGAWQPYATATLSAASTYAVTVRPDTAGTWLLRVSRPADATHAAGVSRTLTVTVT